MTAASSSPARGPQALGVWTARLAMGLLGLGTLSLPGCGDGAEESTAASTTTSGGGGSGGTTSGGCPPGQVAEQPDGCRPAGVPTEECAPGFFADKPCEIHPAALSLRA